MKKSLALALFLGLVSAGQAQQFKLIVGPAISHYSDEWPADGFIHATNSHLNPFENRRKGFMAGCGVEFRLNKHVSAELDGLYFRKGSTFEVTTPIFYSYRDVFTLSGLNVPLFIKLKLLSGTSPYILGGLEFSYVMAHSVIQSYWPEAGSGWIELPKKDLAGETRRFGFGPIIGLGFEARVTKVFLFLEARYNLGLVDLCSVQGFYRPEIKTASLVILTGVKFN